MPAYYNEHDKYAAAWLRNLIAAGLIAPGYVDERSIEDVLPSELAGYTQCHFFAGIGVWSHALRRAGWPDDRPVWTGSCPCQPFSAAGKGGGTADERHLWPAFFHLIQHAKPRDVVVFGEQVASKPGLAWLDLVHADLEGQGYAVGAIDLCAAGVGAPHIRQRSFFVAHPESQHDGRGESGQGRRSEDSDRRPEGELADHQTGRRSKEHPKSGRRDEGTGSQGGERPVGSDRSGVALGDAEQRRREGGAVRSGAPKADESAEANRPCSGFWHPADWLPCIDGKARPVEPGTFPLAHGASARVGRLRAYGNAIVAPVAEAFIRAYLSR